MMKVLFVDDEPMVLEGLQQALRPQRREWEMVFALGGGAAIEALEDTAFDVVVSDMRMPKVDGSAVLRRAAERSPQTVRIALSAQTDMGAMLRTVGFVHLFLAKPCDTKVLVDAISRVRQLHALLDSPALRALVGATSSLPTPRGVYAALERAVMSPTTGLDSIAEIVAQDVGLSAKILQLVNSAFFGLPRSSTRIEHAVNYLGLTVLRALVLAHEIATVFNDDAEFPLEAYERHAHLVGSIARRLVRERTRSEEAFVAALLHDVGKMILASQMPQQYRAAMHLSMANAIPMHAAELELFGTTHAEVGAYLLGLWGIPFTIVEAVANHHAPGRVSMDGTHEVLTAVHVADALAHELRSGERAALNRLDMQFLETRSVDMAAWRNVAADCYQG